MGIICPPPPLTKEKFDKRIKFLETNNMEISMKNIDPAFYNYSYRQNTFNKFSMIIIFVGFIIFVIAFVALMSGSRTKKLRQTFESVSGYTADMRDTASYKHHWRRWKKTVMKGRDK
jgi:hypothetical protein